MLDVRVKVNFLTLNWCSSY